jgi:hypothetical protein
MKSSGDVNGHSVKQEISRLFRKPKFKYPVHMKPVLSWVR